MLLAPATCQCADSSEPGDESEASRRCRTEVHERLLEQERRGGSVAIVRRLRGIARGVLRRVRPALARHWIERCIKMRLVGFGEPVRSKEAIGAADPAALHARAVFGVRCGPTT